MVKFRPLSFLILIAIVTAAGFWAVRSGILPIHPQAGKLIQNDTYYCPMHPTYTADRPGTCPICNMSLVKKEKVESDHEGHEEGAVPSLKSFTIEELVKMKPGEICLLHKCKTGKCTMVMTEKFARLGKCPSCGEDLGVSIRLDAPGGYAAVKLGKEKQQVIGIKTAPVQRLNISKVIRTVGRVAYDPELYQAQEEFLQAVQAAQKAQSAAAEIKEQAEKLVDSSKIRLRLLGLSEELIQEIESSGKADRSLLYSEPGGTVWLYAPIYEYEIPLVKSGSRIEAQVSTFPEETFEGVIRSIDRVLDPVTRSARVRASLDNSAGLLKPEMYVNAVIRVDLGERLAVAKEAVFQTGEKNIVFVATAPGAFEPREVTVGVETEEVYEIRSGLAEGEAVVTSGNFLIDSESRLKAALEGLGKKEGHTHGV